MTSTALTLRWRMRSLRAAASSLGRTVVIPKTVAVTPVDVEPGSSLPQSEFRVAEAQLAGWLEGLVEGVQASVATQDAATPVAQARQEQQAQQQPQPPTLQDRHRYR